MLEKKIPSPPLLPVYNSLRRLFEIVEDKDTIEKLCEYAQIFRPFVSIPFVGEILSPQECLSHKCITRETNNHQDGCILEITKAAIIVKKSKMPLCLPGEFIVAKSYRSYKKVLELTTPLVAILGEEFQNLWENLPSQPQNLTSFLKILLLNTAMLNEELWNEVCKIGTEQNLNFITKQKIAASTIHKEKFAQVKFRIAHEDKHSEGTILSQSGDEVNIVTVASGIPSKIIHHFENMHRFVINNNQPSPIQDVAALTNKFFSITNVSQTIIFSIPNRDGGRIREFWNNSR